LPLIPKQNVRNAPNKSYNELSSKKLSKCHTSHIWNRLKSMSEILEVNIVSFASKASYCSKGAF